VEYSKSRDATFETETRSETFETEAKTREIRSRVGDQVSRLYHCWFHFMGRVKLLCAFLWLITWCNNNAKRKTIWTLRGRNNLFIFCKGHCRILTPVFLLAKFHYSLGGVVSSCYLVTREARQCVGFWKKIFLTCEWSEGAAWHRRFLESPN